MKLEHESVAILAIYTLGPSVVPSVGYIQSYIDDSEGMCQVAELRRPRQEGLLRYRNVPMHAFSRIFTTDVIANNCRVFDWLGVRNIK